MLAQADDLLEIIDRRLVEVRLGRNRGALLAKRPAADRAALAMLLEIGSFADQARP